MALREGSEATGDANHARRSETIPRAVGEVGSFVFDLGKLLVNPFMRG